MVYSHGQVRAFSPGPRAELGRKAEQHPPAGTSVRPSLQGSSWRADGGGAAMMDGSCSAGYCQRASEEEEK